MESSILYLNNTPEVKWFEWNEIESLKETGQFQLLDISSFCLIYSPADYRFFVAFFCFEEMLWKCNHGKDSKTFRMYDIAYWAFLPELPKGWNLDIDDILVKTDEWALGEEERATVAKVVEENIKKGI